MIGIEMHYILGGLIVLAGSVIAVKVFDYLSSQSVKRLSENRQWEPRLAILPRTE